jgi:hypothetical protein
MDTLLWIGAGLISLIMGLVQFVLAVWIIFVIYQLIFHRDRMIKVGEMYVEQWDKARKESE